MDEPKPRHIRDIAHLYLSRMQSQRAGISRIVVTSTGADCFSGFHCANIALAFAVSGRGVSLVEASGRLPSSAYYLSLPPAIHLGLDSEVVGEEISAMGGVRVIVSRTGRVRDDPAEGASTRPMTVVHAPPMDDREASDTVLASFESGHGETAVVLLSLDVSACEAAWDAVRPRVPGARRLAVLLEDPIEGAAGGLDWRVCGAVRHWSRFLLDRVACVARDPESHISRCYARICEAITAGTVAGSPRTMKTNHETYSNRRAASRSG